MTTKKKIFITELVISILSIVLLGVGIYLFMKCNPGSSTPIFPLIMSIIGFAWVASDATDGVFEHIQARKDNK